MNVQVNATSAGKMELLVTDVAGRIIARQPINVQTGSNILSYDASAFAAGIYWLYANGQQGRTSPVRFVKQ